MGVDRDGNRRDHGLAPVAGLKDGEVVGDLPVEALVDDCPLYDLEPAEPATAIYAAPERTLDAHDAGEVLRALLGSPNIASRRPVFEQYDCLVQSRTVRRPEEADAAVLLLPEQEGGGPRGAIAVSIDGSGRRVACDPYRGAAEAVFECAANLACTGALGLGLTNCLNFGNPEKPHIAWQLTRAVHGVADACRALDVPVVGGNVSLYNEGADGPIYPTPVVGMVGELPNAEAAGRLGFAREGDAIALIRCAGEPSLGGSELAKLRGEALPTELPAFDLAALASGIRTVALAVRGGLVASCHDIAEGGLAVALAECCIAGEIGAHVELPDVALPEATLFGEGPGRFVVSGRAEDLHKLGLPMTVLGTVGGDRLALRAGSAAVDVPVAELREAWAGGLAALLP